MSSSDASDLVDSDDNDGNVKASSSLSNGDKKKRLILATKNTRSTHGRNGTRQCVAGNNESRLLPHTPKSSAKAERHRRHQRRRAEERSSLGQDGSDGNSTITSANREVSAQDHRGSVRDSLATPEKMTTIRRTCSRVELDRGDQVARSQLRVSSASKASPENSIGGGQDRHLGQLGIRRKRLRREKATRRTDDSGESATGNGDYCSGDSDHTKCTRQKRRMLIKPTSAEGVRNTCNTGRRRGLDRASAYVSKSGNIDVHIADSDSSTPCLGADACESSEEEEFSLESDDHASKEKCGARLGRTPSKGDCKGKHFPVNECKEIISILRSARPPTEGEQRSRVKPKVGKDGRPGRLSQQAAALSSDDEGILKDSDSDSESYDRADRFAERVNCRCGAEDWKDGEQWIRCDGRDCWTWEHSRCAYPSKEEIVQSRVHLCQRCIKKGSGVAVRSLARGAGETTAKRRKSSSTLPPCSSTGGRSGTLTLRHDDGRKEELRRSRRIAGTQLGIKPLLRHGNVVKETQYSSEDGVFVRDGTDSEYDEPDLYAAVAEQGENSRDGAPGNGDDRFMAPEGKVIAWKEFRCRCGATRENEGFGGGGTTNVFITATVDDRLADSGAGAANTESDAYQWVQCHSDYCGIWEHSACCDYGCAEERAVEVRQVTTKHWCRACDPKGKKHRKATQRKLNQQPRRRKGGVVPDGPGSGGDVFMRKLTGKAQTVISRVDLQKKVLLHDMWTAVVTGDIAGLEKAFREADEASGACYIRQLLDAKSPSMERFGLLFSDTDGEAATMGASRRTTIPMFFPAGLTLLMLAAGYWRTVESGSISSAESADAHATIADEPAEMNDGDVAVNESGIEKNENSVEPMSSADMDVLRARAAPALAVETERKDEQNHESLTAGKGSKQEFTPVVDTPRSLAAEEKTLVVAEPSRGLHSETRVDVLRLVLRRYGNAAAILTVDGEARTAVHHAAAVNGVGEVELLLEEGEPAVRAAFMKDHRGFTPLLVAAFAGHTDAFIAILKALPVESRAIALNATEQLSGDNALHLACAAGHDECVKAILKEADDVQSALYLKSMFGMEDEAGVTLVMARNSEGSTPLMVAAGGPSSMCLKLVLQDLMRRSFDSLTQKLEELRTQDDKGMNALHWVSEGSIVAAKALINAERFLARLRIPSLKGKTGCDGWDDLAMINCRDNENGASPLHLAAAVSHKDMVTCFLDAGANPVMLDARSWTPVMYADFDGRKEGAIVELLQHQPEKQLQALGDVWRSPDGRNQPRVTEVVRNLATVPAFFSVVNGFIRNNPGLLLTSLRFLREEPGLLDFENKRTLLWTLLALPYNHGRLETIHLPRGPGEALGTILRWMQLHGGQYGKHRLASFLRERRLSFSFLGEPGYGPGVDREAWEMIAEDLVRSQPPSSLTPSATAKLPAAAPQQLLRESTAATLQMQSPTSCNAVAACSPSSTIDCGWGGASSVIDLTSIDAGADFAKHKEQHYGGVAESTMTVPNGADAVEIVPAAAMAATQIGKGSMPTNRNRGSSRGKAYFVPVDGSMSSYCPRDLVCESTVNGRVASSGKDSAGDGDSAVAWRAKGGGGADRVGKGDAYMDDLKAFEFIGVIIGANLAWEKVLNLNLNPVVWKTLLSRKISVADLDLVDESYSRSLSQMLKMEGTDQLGLSFGDLDLKCCDGGDKIDPEQDVTDDNKEVYALMALESRTFGRWRAQCRAMSEGLRKLVPLHLLKIFTENELGLLLAGAGEIDPDDWQQNTVFSGGASADIRGWFWSVVRSLTKEERSLLLQFATGRSRLPVGGFAALPLPFQVTMLDFDARLPLPRAATCFFMLKLPRYPDLYSLQKNLLIAIRHGASGFAFS